MKSALPFLLLLSFAVFAIEKPPEAEDGEGDQATYANEDVLELDKMSVQGERLTLKKETRLRIVRQAMNEPRSNKKEDRDKMLCWLETPVGTHFSHVTCARNGDLEALRNGGKDGQIGGAAGYGRNYYWRSLQAENESSLRNVMDGMPNNGYFDQEFAVIASNGGTPPRDVPEEEELHRFVNAYLQVQNLTAEGKPEEEVVSAIEAEGLTLKRYNRVVELVGSYQSIKDKVTEFVIEAQNPEAETS